MDAKSVKIKTNMYLVKRVRNVGVESVENSSAALQSEGIVRVGVTF